MTAKQNILSILFFVLSLTLSGQKTQYLNTNEIDNLIAKYGFSNLIETIYPIPIYMIDQNSAQKLARLAVQYEPTNMNELFIVDYALHINDSLLPQIIYRYFKNNLVQIDDFKTNENGYIPSIYESSLVVITKFPTDSTEQLLIDYYHEWKKKSETYSSGYSTGLISNDEKLKKKLMWPYQNCNISCYKILIALKVLNSDFYSQEKLEYHKSLSGEKYLTEFLSLDGNMFDYYDNKESEIITLKQNYSTIEKFVKSNKRLLNYYIKGTKYPRLRFAIYKLTHFRTYLSNKKHSKCWNVFIFNDQIGYINYGCTCGDECGGGRYLKIELLEKNKIKITVLSSWIS